MLLRKNKELQSLLEARTKALKNAEQVLDTKNELVKLLQMRIDELNQENIDLKNNLEFVTNNSKDNKIKELIADDQSNN